MSDQWLREYERAERLLRELASRKVEARSAASVTLARAQSNQICTILMLLERGVSRLTDAAERLRCSDMIDTLRHQLRQVEASQGLSTDHADDRGNLSTRSTGRGSRSSGGSFRSQLSMQEEHLENLHSSVRSLKNVGQELSAEIEEHVTLLADLEDRTTTIVSKQLTMRDRLLHVTAAGFGLCGLYLIVIVLGVILVQLILTLS